MVLMTVAYENCLQIQWAKTIAKHLDSRVPSRINEMPTVDNETGSVMTCGRDNYSRTEEGNFSLCSFHFILL